MKTTFVTGAGGFVGANLVRALLARGHTVHVLNHDTAPKWRRRGLEDDLCVHYASVLDLEALRAMLAQIKPDWIFHLAAYGAYSSQSGSDAIFDTNLIGTKNLLEASIERGFEAFVNTGTSSEYGFCDHAPEEWEMPQPNSAYSYSKTAATMYCTFRASQAALKIATLRPYSVYGPYEDPTRFVPRLLATGIAGTYPPLVDPSIARDFVYADDVTRAYEMVAETAHATGAIYNVGSGIQTTIGAAVDVARRNFGLADDPQWGTMHNRSWDTSIWVANNRKIRTDIGWVPVVDLPVGLRKMTAWLRESPGMLSFYNSEHEPPR